MQLNEIIDSLTEWVQINLCDGVELLKPSSNNMPNAYEIVNPNAFALFVPTKDQLPPDIDYQMPSICVQLKEGADNMESGVRSLNIRLAFSTYRPGHFIEEEEEGEKVVKFVKDAEGWKDLWLWISKSVNKIQTEMYIEGARISKKTPVRYGHFQVDEGLVGDYPNWFAWIEFTIDCGISSKSNNYNNYL